MKRMFLWLMVAVFAALVVGCDGGTTPGDEDNTTRSADAPAKALDPTTLNIQFD